jgi:hypothetical protein
MNISRRYILDGASDKYKYNLWSRFFLSAFFFGLIFSGKKFLFHLYNSLRVKPCVHSTKTVAHQSIPPKQILYNQENNHYHRCRYGSKSFPIASRSSRHFHVAPSYNKGEDVNTPSDDSLTIPLHRQYLPISIRVITSPLLREIH